MTNDTFVADLQNIAETQEPEFFLTRVIPTEGKSGGENNTRIFQIFNSTNTSSPDHPADVTEINKSPGFITQTIQIPGHFNIRYMLLRS